MLRPYCRPPLTPTPEARPTMSHEKLETNIGWMAMMIALVISFGGLLMEVSGIAGAQLILAGDVNPLSVIAEPSTHFLGCDLRIMPG